MPDSDRKRRLSRLADRAEEGGLTPNRGSTAERDARGVPRSLAVPPKPGKTSSNSISR